MFPEAAARHSALSGERRSRALGAAVAGAVLAVAVGPAALAPMASAEDAPSGWASSTWTGVVAGAPVPGAGLPPAAVPTAPVPLPATYDVAPTYEGQQQCDALARPGASRLADLIRATYGPDQVIGITRNCSIGGQSEHKEGRAVDWMVDVRTAQSRANAEAFLNWLLGPDQFGVPYGNAMRIGVMYIGWNDRIWRGYDLGRGWTELKGCFSQPDPSSDNTCHRNHIHISLTWDGASGLTSMWDGTPQDVPYCPRVSTAATPVVAEVRGAPVGIEPARVIDSRAALGVPSRCRLLQGTWSKHLTRMLVPVLGQGQVPATGVDAVKVRVSALGSNAPSRVRIWTPGQGGATDLVTVPMGGDAAAEISLPVSTSGNIALATTAGATDIVVEILGYYPAGTTGDPVPMQPSPVAPTQSIGAVPPPPVPPPGGPAAGSPPTTPGEPPIEGEQPPLSAPVQTAPVHSAGPFVALGSTVGYESSAQGAIQPGEERTVALAGVPVEATTAVVFVTAKEAAKAGAVRVGQPGKRTVRVPFVRKRMSKAVLVVPVTGGSVVLKAKKSSVQVRIEVLGYGTAAGQQYVPLPDAKVFSGTLTSGQPRSVKVIGNFGLPKKVTKITAVLLRVQTRKAATAGTVAVFASGGAAPPTRSAPVMANQKFAAMVLAPVGSDGHIVFWSNVDAKVTARIVGYVR